MTFAYAQLNIYGNPNSPHLGVTAGASSDASVRRLSDSFASAIITADLAIRAGTALPVSQASQAKPAELTYLIYLDLVYLAYIAPLATNLAWLN